MLPPINAPDRQAEAFPVLTPAQIDRIRPYGNVRSVQAGEVAFRTGQVRHVLFRGALRKA